MYTLYIYIYIYILRDKPQAACSGLGPAVALGVRRARPAPE